MVAETVVATGASDWAITVGVGITGGLLLTLCIPSIWGSVVSKLRVVSKFPPMRWGHSIRADLQDTDVDEAVRRTSVEIRVALGAIGGIALLAAALRVAEALSG